MGKKKFLLITLILSVLCCNLYAKVISIQVLQHDSTEKDIKDSTYIIEDSVFEYFFDRGIIVSNSPICTSESEKKDNQLFRAALGEAREGGVDYFVMIIAFYDFSDSKNPDGNLLGNISKINWKIVNVHSDEIIAEGSRNPSSFKTKDVKAGVSTFAGTVADDIYRAIRTKG